MKKELLPINAIYRATEGEGIFVGYPQVFIRTQGCSIGCLNCDSMDTWEFDKETNLSIDSILKELSVQTRQGSIKRVSITGGDPLHPNNTTALIGLINELKARRYFVNIEAAGTRVVHEVFDRIDFISFDYKTPCTGVETSFKLLKEQVENYSSKTQIKSVIQDRKDFDFVLGAYEKLNEEIDLEHSFSWVLTPAYNLEEEFPEERFRNVIDWNEKEGSFFRVIGQQHKWIHGPNAKHV